MDGPQYDDRLQDQSAEPSLSTSSITPNTQVSRRLTRSSSRNLALARPDGSPLRYTRGSRNRRGQSAKRSRCRNTVRGPGTDNKLSVNSPHGPEHWTEDMDWTPSSTPISANKDSSAVSSLEKMYCFGMVTGIECECSQSNMLRVSTPIPANLTSPSTFNLAYSDGIEGRIFRTSEEMIKALLDLSTLQLQVLCTTNASDANPMSKRTTHSPQRSLCLLSIIVYGPDEWFDRVGQFFEEFDIDLHRPKNCDRNVPYRNPHTLASLDPPPYPMTLDLGDMDASSWLQNISHEADLLDTLTTEEELREAPQPQAIRTRLESHQKQALTFLLRRENGWIMDDSAPDIWQFQKSHPQPFVNRISGNRRVKEPNDFRGGILADPMGLGKTLTMISLVASDLESTCLPHDSVQLTLVILPPSLLSTWEEQLEEHLIPNKLPLYMHHGKSRISTNLRFNQPGIVLTTYHTIANEWKRSLSEHPSLLLTTQWRRIVLDEAHLIRNQVSQITKAICSLNASSRWVITGTPIQNRLTDLSTLLKFLRVDPYDNSEAFESDIVTVWKQGNPEESIDRLKRLMRCLLLRRTKRTIQLPLRTDMKYPLDFRPEERKIYEAAHQNAVRKVEEALLQFSDSSTSCLNALQQIDTLRHICNLGLFYKSTNKRSSDGTAAQYWTSNAQRCFNQLLEFGDAVCRVCSMSIDMVKRSANEQQKSQMQIFSCLQVICATCTQRASSAAMRQCGHVPACHVAAVQSDGEDGESLPLATPHDSWLPFPTKIQALLSQLKSVDGIKSLVFSFWITTLDVIEMALKDSNVTYTRFDGKMSQKRRTKAIERFRNDPSVQVMLLTLSCGAAGLNLTAASRVYLMEPHWNPTVEEQALARVHRIGQTREVITVRFYIRNSFEEHVIKIQKAKRELADIILSTPNAQSNPSLQHLQHLRLLL